jgi:hypothetical protein
LPWLVVRAIADAFVRRAASKRTTELARAAAWLKLGLKAKGLI